MEYAKEQPSVNDAASESLRSVMRAWSAGVAVVTAIHDNTRHGMTVNSFTSISLDPPLVSISLQSTSRTHAMILRSGVFGLTILSEGQVQVSERFAGKNGDSADRFSGLEITTLASGSPLIVGGLAWLDCRVLQTVPAGLNTLFIAEVTASHVNGEGRPLIYHNRGYWHLGEVSSGE